jgi:hypothetical protein
VVACVLFKLAGAAARGVKLFGGYYRGSYRLLAGCRVDREQFKSQDERASSAREDVPGMFGAERSTDVVDRIPVVSGRSP